jgi:uncharacterized protein YhaN
MKLERLRVEGFGCLAEREFEFSPGLNVVFGPNESGKSTLQQAILAGLFGFYTYRPTKGGRAPDAEVLAERRYEPLGGGRYACAVEYSLDDGRRYRIERRFGDRRSARVLDLASGRDVSAEAQTDRNGAFERESQLRLLGTTRELFAGSAWVGQAALHELMSPGALSDAVEAQLDSGPGGQSASRAKERLKAARDKWTGAGRAGELGKAKARQAELRGELAWWQEKRREAAQLEERIQACEKELQQAAGREKELEGQLRSRRLADLEGLIGRAHSLQEKLGDLERRIRELAHVRGFPASMREDILAARQALSSQEELVGVLERAQEGGELERARQEVGRLQGEISALEDLRSFPGEREGEFLRLEAALKAAPARPASQLSAAGRLGMLLLVLAIPAGAFVGIALQSAVAGIAAGFLLLVMALAVLAMAPRKEERPVAQEAAATVDAAALRAFLSFLRECGIGAQDPETGAEEFRRRLEGWKKLRDLEKELVRARELLEREERDVARLEEARAELERRREALLALFRQAGIESVDLEEAWRAFERGCREYGQLQDLEREKDGMLNQLEALLGGRSLQEFEKTRDALLREGVAASAPDIPLEELQRRLEEARRERQEREKELESLRGELRGSLGAGFDPAAVEEELAEVCRKIQVLERFMKALEEATKGLEEAAEEARREVVPAAAERAAELLESVTAGRYGQVELVEEGSFRISLLGPGVPGRLPVEQASQGTREQAWFCLRLALAEALGEGEKMPLVLDDPFVNCDAARLDRLLALLVAMAGERQVLFFTKDGQALARLQELAGESLNVIELG